MRAFKCLFSDEMNASYVHVCCDIYLSIHMYNDYIPHCQQHILPWEYGKENFQLLHCWNIQY